MNPEDILKQLHDIDGIDPVSWWPLAIGWWVVMVIGLLIAAALIWYVAFRIAFKRSWKNDTLQKLSNLEKNLSQATARESLIDLSEYLRRIALKRFPRNECAGLSGEAWLKWLSKNDPNNFDWEKNGTLLVDIPYAPSNTDVSSNQIKDLIYAVRNWVR